MLIAFCKRPCTGKFADVDNTLNQCGKERCGCPQRSILLGQWWRCSFERDMRCAGRSSPAWRLQASSPAASWICETHAGAFLVAFGFVARHDGLLRSRVRALRREARGHRGEGGRGSDHCVRGYARGYVCVLDIFVRGYVRGRVCAFGCGYVRG